MRLTRFDYSTSHFYMVKIKVVKEAMPFASICNDLVPNMSRNSNRAMGSNGDSNKGDVL